MFLFFFFFSSRRRHTRCSRDWSSDVCSSDLPELRGLAGRPPLPAPGAGGDQPGLAVRAGDAEATGAAQRERRVAAAGDRESGGEGERVELGGGRIIKKKKRKKGQCDG